MEQNRDFTINNISEKIMARMQGKSFKADCQVKREDLRYLQVLYKDLAGKTQQGEMVCHQAIAAKLVAIFQELYGAGYPIERMQLIDDFDADDERSMEANNASCFNYRLISHTNRISKHGLGMAVDINPLYNPYVKTVAGRLLIEPAAAAPYIDRRKAFPCKITVDDLCCQLFKAHGFIWGGDWTDRKDYQHFELADDAIRQFYPEY